MSDETDPFPDPPEPHKHKNKRCDENYIIGEYFPCERAEDLENVKWLFGMEIYKYIKKKNTLFLKYQFCSILPKYEFSSDIFTGNQF